MNNSLQHPRGVLRPPAWCLPAMLVMLAACAGASSAPAGAAALVGTEWRLESINGLPVMDRSAASLQFPESGRVAGNGSCNTFVGAVAVDNESIIFRQMASTKMACMGGAGEQETRYMEALRQAQRYQVQDGQLLIHVQGMDQPLRFTKK
ncbi:heat shock protein HslJ [Hydrogenophaga palleronii]|uniref:Heat shock protein HslJ n=1 Tax=Hydrogenophaga palleronii TaxID=65655 RepID=A0ABU1WMA2_9BURK|nr:META domain-containing protein [Hydrogenophaga palleronii]MDR7150415.1 heat shock protein HslJ [Hydrogenophaga palleronii]